MLGFGDLDLVIRKSQNHAIAKLADSYVTGWPGRPIPLSLLPSRAALNSIRSESQPAEQVLAVTVY